MTDQGARAAPGTAAPTGLGAAITLDALAGRPYELLAQLRAVEPVAWLPVLGGWLVTRRDLCIEVMRDADRFTVDDPRFSTAQVVGPSMLSLDGPEHRRHRDPFATAFHKPEVAARFTTRVQDAARSLVASLAARGGAEIRRDLAGPLAVEVVAAALDLLDTEPAAVLGWYDEIVAAVDRVSVGGEIGPARAGGRADAGATRLEHDRRAARRARRGHRDAQSGRGRLERRGHDVRRHRDRRGHDHEPVLAPADRTRTSWPPSAPIGPSARTRSRNRFASSRRPRGSIGTPRRTSSWPGRRIARGDLVIVSLTAANRDPAAYPGARHVRHRRGQRPDPRRIRPGTPRLRRAAPGEARDAGRARRRARRLARPAARRRRDGSPGSSSASLARCRSAGITRPRVATAPTRRRPAATRS